MTNPKTNWLLASDAPVLDRRVSGGVEYHRVYAGEKRRIFRGILAILLLFVGFIGFAQLFVIGAAVVDAQVFGRTGQTPLQHAAGSLALVVLIPYSVLLQRVLYGVPARSLHSVAGRFRYGVFARSLLAFGPFLLIVIAYGYLVPGETIPWSTGDLVALFVVGMLLTPLAAAGEEYGLRGFMFRVVGGWTRGARSGAVLGIIVTTVLFSLAHGTLDPFLLSTYLVLFSSMAIVTWRTGGLEVAIALHGVYNMTSLVLGTTLHLDLFGSLDSRGEITGSPASLVPSAGLVIITAIVWWMTRKTGPARTVST
jgi:uncharacterized protein